jgi:hypothetical protein
MLKRGEYTNWTMVMEVNLQAASIEENNTWSLIDPMPGHRPMGMKWVYKIKKKKTVGH